MKVSLTLKCVLAMAGFLAVSSPASEPGAVGMLLGAGEPIEVKEPSPKSVLPAKAAIPATVVCNRPSFDLSSYQKVIVFLLTPESQAALSSAAAYFTPDGTLEVSQSGHIDLDGLEHLWQLNEKLLAVDIADYRVGIATASLVRGNPLTPIAPLASRFRSSTVVGYRNQRVTLNRTPFRVVFHYAFDPLIYLGIRGDLSPLFLAPAGAAVLDRNGGLSGLVVSGTRIDANRSGAEALSLVSPRVIDAIQAACRNEITPPGL